MDYMINGVLVEIQPEEKTQDLQLKEYLERFRREKEGAENAE